MTPQRKWGIVVWGFVILYLVFSGNRGLWNLYKLHQEKIKLTEQISQLRSDINQHQTEYQTLEKNPGLVEKQAREELNLAKPGEVVYKFKSSSNH